MGVCKKGIWISKSVVGGMWGVARGAIWVFEVGSWRLVGGCKTGIWISKSVVGGASGVQAVRFGLRGM